ncbi:hypothetical protein OSSY52_21620 [Tepiditoga spiralis]|uniref:Phosphoesterase n=1 Tax=Tepiditoga spiralis TaxID=2108365 RepID=A0A7G1G6F6_9BACT|nr:YfcE family phosphodiesterase [Tepiditoga spiralis]BBE32021.1 hypothetical protein OSSY52_21620 [Tepiditoga spiralis]
MKILVLSDLHIPTRCKFEKLLTLNMNEYSHIIVTGDITDEDTYFYLNSQNAILHAVYGNMDDYYLKSILPEKKIIKINDKKIGIIHGHQTGRGYTEGLINKFENLDLMIYGHSHVKDLRKIGKTLVLNPGAFCDRKYAEIIINDKINIKMKVA